MSPVHHLPLGPLVPGEGSRPFLALALEDGAPPRPVVLVWAPPEVTQEPTMLTRLERETQRATIFDHPNILRVHGLVTLEGRLARVTEYADGEPLRRVLEVGQRMPPPFAVLVAADVAMGVHYAHVAGSDDGTPLIHGDLRPETVMVSFSGVCKVSGYGALSVAPRERNILRKRNQRLYSAPEQLMGGRAASSVLTDVYLLGLLLYECLSGRKPFQDSLEPDKAILNRPLPPLPTDVPAALNDVVRRATAKRADQRYPSALAFREALVAALGTLPTPAAFAEHLAKLLSLDGEARIARNKMIEKGIEAVRNGTLPTLAAIPPAAPITQPVPVLPPDPISRSERIIPAAPITQPVPVVTDTSLTQTERVIPIAPGGPPSSPEAAGAEAAPPPTTSVTLPAEPVVPAAPAHPPRSRGLLAIAIGAVLLLSAAGTIWSIRNKPANTEAPEEVYAAEPPLVPSALLTAEPEAPKDAGVRAPSKPEAAPAAPAAPSVLELFVNPDVDVAINGKPVGRTPLTVPLPLGRHTLTLSDEAKGLRTAKAIDITHDGTSTFHIRLGMGAVLVHAPPGAHVSLDGKDMGTAPLSELTTFEGPHQLRVTLNEAVWEQTFQLQGEQRLVFNAEFEEQ